MGHTFDLDRYLEDQWRECGATTVQRFELRCLRRCGINVARYINHRDAGMTHRQAVADALRPRRAQ
jgi:hypothetical protein